jgi:hypothetical protein
MDCFKIVFQFSINGLLILDLNGLIVFHNIFYEYSLRLITRNWIFK